MRLVNAQLSAGQTERAEVDWQNATQYVSLIQLGHTSNIKGAGTAAQ